MKCYKKFIILKKIRLCFESPVSHMLRVDKFVFPIDFTIINFNANEDTLVLLGKSFFETGRTLIDVEKGKLTMRVNIHPVVFYVLMALNYSKGRRHQTVC